MVAAVLLTVLLAVLLQARADVDGDRFYSQEWGIRMAAPANWRMTEQTSYSSILLWMHRHSPSGKMLLSAERLEKKLTALEYAEDVSKQLTAIGFTVGKPQLHTATGAYSIELDNGTTYLRQALLVVNDTGYALTLSAPDNRNRTYHLRAFDYALRSLRVQRHPEPQIEPPAAAPHD